MPLSFISDEPVSKDGNLGFDKYVNGISDCVEKTSGPFTLGIFGGWGTGKTSLMKMIEAKLEENKDENIVVWFNAWQYENEKYIIIPFLSIILKSLEKEKNETYIKKFEENLKNLLFAKIADFSFSVPFYNFPLFNFNFKQKKSAKDSILENQTLYQTSFKGLNEACKVMNKKIIVIIDDLDRCNPEKAIRILETIKLVLNQKGFIFILGIAQEMIDDYMEKLYREEYGMKEDHFNGQNYLDKIVQLPFVLPPHTSKINKFVDGLMEDIGGTGAGTNDEKIKSKIENLKDLLPVLCNDNPRSIIRLINLLILIGKIREEINLGSFTISLGLKQNPLTKETIKEIEEKNLYKFLLQNILEKGKRKLKIKKRGEEIKIEEKIKGEFSDETIKVKRKEAENILLKQSIISEVLSSKIGIKWLWDDKGRKAAEECAETQKEAIEEESKIEKAKEEKVGVKKEEKEEKQFKNAIARDPENPDGYFEYAEYLSEVRGSYLPSIEMYNKVIKLYERIGNIERGAEALNSKGTVLEKLGNYQEAIKNYQRARKMDPNNKNAYNMGALKQTFSKDFEIYIDYSSFSPDGKEIMVREEDKYLRIYNRKTGEQTFSKDFENPIHSPSFSPDGKEIVVNERNKYLRIYSRETGKYIFRKDFESYIYSPSFSPDGKNIMVNKEGRYLKIYSRETEKEIFSKDFESYIYSPSFSPDGKEIMAREEERDLKIYEIIFEEGEAPNK